MSVPRKTPCPTQKGCKRGYLVFTERDWNQGCCHGNNTVGVILFLLWCTFLVSSFKITAPIFLEIFLIHYFVVLVDIIIQKREYLWNESRHSEKESTIPLYFEKSYRIWGDFKTQNTFNRNLKAIANFSYNNLPRVLKLLPSVFDHRLTKSEWITWKNLGIILFRFSHFFPS